MTSTKTQRPFSLSRCFGAHSRSDPLAMHLKLKGNYVVGVFLLSAITATTIPPVCWCKPAGQTGWGPRGETDTGVMTQYGERTGRTSTAFENEDGGRRLEPSGGKPVHSFTHSVSSSARRGRVTAPNNPQQSEQESMYPSAEPSREHCSPGHIQHVVPGRFYVTGHLEVTVPHVGYQSDSALSGETKLTKLYMAQLNIVPYIR